MDNIKTWTGLSVEESVRMMEDRDKWRKYVHAVAETRIEDGDRTGQNRTVKESLNRDILTETSSRANVAHHCR